MERFVGINWKRRTLSVLLSASVVAGTLSGCTASTLDSVRPEVNRHQGMLVFPEQYADAIGEMEDQDGTENVGDGEAGGGIDSGGENNDGTGGGTIVENSAAFDALPYNVVASSDYNKYLDEKVYKPIKEILDSLEGDAAQHLYFRVSHSGYEPFADDTSLIQRGSIYDNRAVGVGSYLRGEVFPNLALKWLSKTPANTSKVTQRRNWWLDVIEGQSVSPNTTWTAAAASGSVDPTLIKMWGNEALDCDTLSEYLQKVRTYSLGTIPNISLKYSLSGGNTTSVLVNDLTGLVENRYHDRMAKTSVDRMFGSYNQYPNRDEVKHDLYFSDEYGVLSAYIDGYSKTIVVLCCFEGYDLDTLLGDKQEQIVSIVRNVYNYTEWTRITEFVPDATVLQAGVKGID